MATARALLLTFCYALFPKPMLLQGIVTLFTGKCRYAPLFPSFVCESPSVHWHATISALPQAQTPMTKFGLPQTDGPQYHGNVERESQ